MCWGRQKVYWPRVAPAQVGRGMHLIGSPSRGWLVIKLHCTGPAQQKPISVLQAAVTLHIAGGTATGKRCRCCRQWRACKSHSAPGPRSSGGSSNVNRDSSRASVAVAFILARCCKAGQARPMSLLHQHSAAAHAPPPRTRCCIPHRTHTLVSGPPVRCRCGGPERRGQTSAAACRCPPRSRRRWR